MPMEKVNRLVYVLYSHGLLKHDYGLVWELPSALYFCFKYSTCMSHRYGSKLNSSKNFTPWAHDVLLYQCIFMLDHDRKN